MKLKISTEERRHINNDTMNETITTPRLLNRTAIKAHALKCSQELRAGKFQRVSQDFIDGVEADFETVLRSFSNACPLGDGFKPVAQADGSLLTGAVANKLCHSLKEVLARIIQRRVHRHPSIGKTLMG